MDKTKEEFVRFIKQAMEDNKSDAFAELYNFLLGCFTRADINLNGKVNIEEFDALIEEAAALPRKYGLAPKSSEMYSTEEVRKAARAQMFKEMNLAKGGFITFEEWISFSIKHIMGKAGTLDRDYLAGDCTKQEFITFIKKAVDKTKPEYRDLYFFLLKCFTDADRDRDGAVNSKEFDAMIEEAAQAPRKHGLAPLSRVMFKSDADRIAKRTTYFRIMDKNRNDTISFDEWLQYAYEHIIGKVAALK